MAEHSGTDIRAHQEMWHSFINIVKWACIFIAIVLILMATFLL
jgi:hypothetical protein